MLDLEEGFDDALRELVAIASGQQLVACAGDGEQLCARRDELYCGLQLVECGEAVASAMNEEAGRVELREVCSAQVLRTLRWVERIGEQQQSVRDAGLRCGQHGGHAASVGMTTKEDAARHVVAHDIDGGAKALLVTLGAAAWGRPAGTRLAEGKIAPEHGNTRRAECISERNEERRGATSSGAMRQDKAILSGGAREVKESANGHIPD